MAGVNKAIIVGRLGVDPEIRYTASGLAVTNLSVATSDTRTDKTTGEKKDRTEWHRVVAFDRLAEICGEYLSKGSQVYIEGRIQTDEWEDKDGIKRYTTKIIASTMQMLGSKGSAEAVRSQPAYQPQQPQQPQSQPQPQYQAQPASSFNESQGPPEDDIPF